MRNLVVLFAVLGVLLAGAGCRTRVTPFSNNYYYGKTTRHYGASKHMHTKSAYWGRHKGGHKGHDRRGVYR